MGTDAHPDRTRAVSAAKIANNLSPDEADFIVRPSIVVDIVKIEAN
jgi:hypothetical protein